MRKIVFLLVLFMALSVAALPNLSFVSLSGVAATGAGVVMNINNASNFTWEMVYTGTPTAITVNLEGSIDGTNWFTLDSSTSTSNEMRHVVNKRVDYLRCNVSAYTVNGSTATCALRAFQN